MAADPPPDLAERESAAAYLAELTGDLAKLARRHGLDVLGYLLDMAHLEAKNATRHISRQG